MAKGIISSGKPRRYIARPSSEAARAHKDARPTVVYPSLRSHSSRHQKPGDSGDNGLSFGLLGEDLPAAVHAGLKIDVVRAAQFARVLVFDVSGRFECICRPAHAASGRRYFSLWHGHDDALLVFRDGG